MYCFALIVWFCCSYHNSSLYDKEKKSLELYKKGIEAKQNQEYLQAIDWFQQALDIDPQSKSIRYHIIEMRFQTDNYQDLDWLIEYHQKHPSELDIIKLLRLYHCKQNTQKCSEYEKIIVFRENNK